MCDLFDVQMERSVAGQSRQGAQPEASRLELLRLQDGTEAWEEELREKKVKVLGGPRTESGQPDLERQDREKEQAKETDKSFLSVTKSPRQAT
jgi:hypothetical protein